MARVLIIGVIVAVAFTLFGLVDAAMSDASRARGLSKPVWIVILVLLPVIGAILWFTIGRGHPAPPVPDEPNLTTRNIDDQVADLERRLRELDDEIYPGEDKEK